MNRTFIVPFAALLVRAVVAEPLPILSEDVDLSQVGSVVTIAYRLDSAPAIVTLELEADGKPLDPAYLTGVTGDVNMKVTTTGTHTLTWKPRQTALKGQKIGNCRAKVTAWPLERPPDYMVVDLAETSAARVRYYATTNDLPGGLLANEDYRKTKLVMRYIPAKGVEWTMGNCGETMIYTSSGTPSYRDPTAEAPHAVTLSNDYWMAVFETTQSQWLQMSAGNGWFWNPSTFKTEGDMRPVEKVDFSWIRHDNTATSADRSTYYYPHAPNDNSWLGKLRARTGLKFDLPGEAQWEFACRAGTGEGEFNNGFRCNNVYGYGDNSSSATYHTGTGRFPGCILRSNQASASSAPDAGGTNLVGSYQPSKWGLYDMHGNVAEWCLDWYRADITGLNGAINANGGTYLDGTTPSALKRVCRGGCWWFYSVHSRSSARSPAKAYGVPAALEYDISTNWGSTHGFRVCCPLEEE